MQNLTQRWTKLGPFFPKIMTRFLIFKIAEKVSPAFPHLLHYMYDWKLDENMASTDNQ